MIDPKHFEGAKTIEEVLDRMGLSAEHEKALKTIPPYADKMADFIADRLSSASKSKKPKKTSADRMVDEFNRDLAESRLPFGDEEIPVRPIGELFSALETALNALGVPDVLFHDVDLGEVTLRGAFQSRSLWERACKVIHDFSISQRAAADLANRCVKIAMSIASRKNWEN
jgi:hypothetical protein